MTVSERRQAYGVRLVRGPFVKLDAHKDHCSTADELAELVTRLRTTEPARPLAADLFSGAGGLSLGLEAAGFKVVLSVDHFAEAVETHAHHFGGLSVDWDMSSPERVEEVARLIRDNGIELLAGGPPCQPFSKAGRYMIRHRVHHGLRDPHDERRDLWRSFLEVVQLARPRAVLMENVPDMALDKEMFILRAMVEELEQLGYSVEERVVDTWRYGVPQFRQRLILVAVENGRRFTWPAEAAERVSVWNAIGEMPEVEGGWRPAGGAEGWTEYTEPVTAFQRRMRDGVPEADRNKLFDHITRPVREDDALAFELMDAKTKYSELPEEFKRYRDDIFDDKYKRLDENDLSRTITAHIAKDGYWYIHPRQNRTLTVREAARLQTFPDWYRFAGPPSAAFRQIGNAVPPALAQHLGGSIREALKADVEQGRSTQWIASTLSSWYAGRSKDKRRLAVPWLVSGNRWHALCGDILLDRAEPGPAKSVWWVIQTWDSPATTLAKPEDVRSACAHVKREHRVSQILKLAAWFRDRPGALAQADVEASGVPGLAESVADLVTLVVDSVLTPDGETVASSEPVLVTKGVLRVASRFTGDPVDRRNKLTDGRLAVARMVGGGPNARQAHLALIELAASVCRPIDPRCSDCPLASACTSSNAEEQHAGHLFRLPPE
ncbi:DNA cytosine methyltransferase [Pseudonocardia sp. WMMC193]|uniref:DNA cytosine methyltransferase n=1 Tax=Pseudonocardia sp. WMMC193 TaxID=2911965 RepID=UPI001EFFE5E6|nr:DNA cytosine methyltransferase [Pseudonocardia sp. WMMC193]MCF7552178.1 DNA (cytosine-5-)-methyltransferase [Pseudonocardia sp. WMMC193]